MIKKNCLFICFFLFSLSFFCYSQEIAVEDGLYILDEGKHLPREFNSILEDISKKHPAYTKAEIGELIISAYYDIQKKGKEISIYYVAKDILVISDDNLGIDLESFILAYIYSRTQ